MLNEEKIRADPTPADFRRSGLFIAAAGIVTALVGIGFYLGREGTDIVAAGLFWFISVLLIVMGGCEAVFANRGGRPGGRRGQNQPPA